MRAFTSFSSSGTAVACSLRLPGTMHMDRGIPSPSINSPISTIGFGRCSLLMPYLRSPRVISPAGHFIHVIVIRGFDLKVEVGTVIITDRGISFYNRPALLIEMADIGIIMLLHEIHRPEDMDIIKIGGLIIVSQMFQRVELGTGVKDPCAGKETVYQVWIEGRTFYHRRSF